MPSFRRSRICPVRETVRALAASMEALAQQVETIIRYDARVAIRSLASSPSIVEVEDVRHGARGGLQR
jgi:hypothetical protein